MMTSAGSSPRKAAAAAAMNKFLSPSSSTTSSSIVPRIAAIATWTRSYSSSTTTTAPWPLLPPRRRIDDEYRSHLLRRRSASRMIDCVVLPTTATTSTTRTISKSASARGSASIVNSDSDITDIDIIDIIDIDGSSMPFLLADIGEGIAEVELLQWFVNPGDNVRQFDRVCEVQSDKASVEITSRYDGVVTKLCGNVGDVMRVGMPLLHIATTTTAAATTTKTKTAAADAKSGDVVREPRGTETTTSSSSSSSSGQETTTTTLHNVDDERDRLSIPLVGSNYSSYYEGGGGGGSGGDAVAAPSAEILGGTFVPRRGVGGGEGGGNATTMDGDGSSTKVLTSPAVRRLGRMNGIDLGTVMGTGPGGRVLKADVLRIIDPGASSVAASSSSSPSSASPTTNAASPRRAADGGAGTTTTNGDDAVVPIRGYHRMMVKTMTSSLRVPHMVYSDEINVNALTEVRDSLRPLYANHSSRDRNNDKNAERKKLTYMPFFVKAASLALSEYPALNSTIDVEGMTLTYHGEHRIGIAVDTPRGLAVPVIGGCQDRSVLEIAEELNRLYSLATDGSLSEADIASPTFTLSNIGAIGGTYMSPVVLPPQVAIGAMGKIQRLPRFVDDDSDVVKSVRIMPISWGGDHRAVDGATMARFSNLWKSYCENPSSMMFAMR